MNIPWIKRLLMSSGVLLLLLAAGLSVYNMVDSDRADRISVHVTDQLVTAIPPQAETDGATQPDHVAHPDKEMPTILVDNQRYIGYLEIPDLNLRLPIAAGEFRLKQLLKTPALYTGSVYQNTMVIAAHNYKSHFGRLNQLDVGAPILFTDAEGNVFRYTVGWSETIAPSDRDQMVTEGEWDLTLFTCTYNGKRRFTLRCVADPS